MIFVDNFPNVDCREYTGDEILSGLKGTLVINNTRQYDRSKIESFGSYELIEKLRMVPGIEELRIKEGSLYVIKAHLVDWSEIEPIIVVLLGGTAKIPDRVGYIYMPNPRGILICTTFPLSSGPNIRIKTIDPEWEDKFPSDERGVDIARKIIKFLHENKLDEMTIWPYHFTVFMKDVIAANSNLGPELCQIVAEHVGDECKIVPEPIEKQW